MNDDHVSSGTFRGGFVVQDGGRERQEYQDSAFV